MGNSIWTKISVDFALVAKSEMPPFVHCPCCSAAWKPGDRTAPGLPLPSPGTQGGVCACQSLPLPYSIPPTSHCVTAEPPGEHLDKRTACHGQWVPISPDKDSHPQRMTEISRQWYQMGQEYLFEASGFHQVHCLGSSNSRILVTGQSGWEKK